MQVSRQPMVCWPDVASPGGIADRIFGWTKTVSRMARLKTIWDAGQAVMRSIHASPAATPQVKLVTDRCNGQFGVIPDPSANPKSASSNSANSKSANPKSAAPKSAAPKSAGSGKIAALPVRPARRPHELPEGALPSILLVEDQPEVRDTLAAILKEYGFTVSTADTAIDALTLIGNGLVFDIMVADFEMPGMNGVDLAAEVRRSSPWLPVILITGYQDEAWLRGERWVLTKPFGSAALLAVLSEAWMETTGASQIA